MITNLKPFQKNRHWDKIYFGWFLEVTVRNPKEGRFMFQSTFINEWGGEHYMSMGDITINSNQLILS